MEQRQLLTSAPVDPLAVTNGSLPSVSFTVYGGTNMASQVIAEDKLQTITKNTVSGSTAFVYNAVSTVNSVQQETVQIQNNYYAGTGSTQFGLQARVNSTGNTFYVLETSVFRASGTGSFTVVKSVAGTVTTLGTYNLAIPLSPATAIVYQDSQFTNTFYNLRFLVQTDAGNTSLTDLKAEVWQVGSAEPSTWQLATTDGDTNLQGAGYGGILEIPTSGTGNGTVNVVGGYSESTTGDAATINTFSGATPAGWNGTYPVTVTFNAAATYGHGTISSYVLDYGDGSTPLTSSAIVNITHSYTAAPAFNYTSTLTVTDSASATSIAQQVISANTSVSTDPTGSLTTDRNGGNGISASNPLLIHFQAVGTSNGSQALSQFMLNFGDGTSMNMPVSGTGTFDLFVDHTYTANGLYTPTLTLVGNDTAAAVVNDSSFPTILVSSTPPTVTLTMNTTTNIMTAVFSEDVGAALAAQVDGNENALGEPEWTDGGFSNALDVRNDNSGGNISLTGAAFTYNSTNFTATWNLTGLVNTSSTSYTARLFGTDIQDQAGNDLDGVNSGFGGVDSTPIHFGATYPTTNVTLATSGTWNTSMPLVFAPSIASGGIQSITTVNVSGSPSTQITFTANAANEAILGNINNGDPIIITDITAAGFTALNGLWYADQSGTTGSPILTIPYSTSLGAWTPGSAGAFHVSSPGEVTLITALKQITGAGSIPTTSKVTNGIDVGLTSQFDTSTLTDPTGFNLNFDNETQLGSDGYIVRSVSGPHLEIVGGGLGGENDAIDAFLQSLGMQIYGPENVYSSTNVDVWQVTPSLATLSGSWDIRSAPSIGYLNDSGGSGGWSYSAKAGWDPFYLFNYGGGTPVPAVAQPGNLGVGSNAADIEAHPDWWSQVSTGTMSSLAFAATAMPLGTVNIGDTFSITLTNASLVSETITITANSSDNSASGIATALYNYIHSDVTDPFFESTSITATTNSEFNTNSATPTYNNPVVEFYPSATGLTYTVTTKKNGVSGDPNFLPSVTKDNELNFTNGNLINSVITNYVAPWVTYAAPGSMLSLSPRDGAGYDRSVATVTLMHSNNPFQTSDVGKDLQGYNQNGVLVDATSESYWALVNAAGKYVLQHEAAGQNLLVGGLAYSSTSQPPSFAMEPDVFMEASEIFQDTSYTIDQQLKIDKALGAVTGLYRNWNIYLEGYYGNPVAPDQQPSNVDTQMALFNDDHVTVLEGEDAPAYGGQMPGYYMAQLISANPANANATTMQNALTAYYNSSFGPAATAMEDDFVMFMGSAADPSLASPPAMATFSGLDFGAFGESGVRVGFNAIVNDNLALQQSFGYLDSASSALLSAYNSGHNASFTLSQYNADQDRVDQLRMYDEFLFLEYKIEYDYSSLGLNKTPAINSASFNLILGDLYNEVYWANDLVNTDQVNAENFDEYFTNYTYKNLSYFTANDPNGSNGIKTEAKGLLKAGPGYPDPTPTQATINNDWAIDEAVLAISAAPTNLLAGVVTSSENDLTWTNNAVSPDAQTGLNIYRAVNSGGVPGAFSLLTSVAATVTSYHDTSAVSGTTYWYEIQSFNTRGSSIYDGPVQPSSSSLTAPNSLAAASISTSEIDLSWNNTNSIQTGVYVDRSTDGATYLPIATLSATATTYSDTGLTDGSQYYYEVQSFDASSTSGNSNVASAVTQLTAPSDLNATATSPSEIDLSWTNNSATQDGFNIDRSTDDSNFTLIASVGSTTTTFNDTALTANTTFYYKVQAFNTAAGDSAFSPEDSDTTSSTLAAPSGLNATAASASQINLTWTNNDGGSATGYDIDRSTSGFNGWSQVATVASGVSAYTDTGLSEGIQYFYEVQASNGSTTSGFSVTANAVTTLAAPNGLSAMTVSTSQINLSWTDNDGGLATGYIIDASTDGINFSQIATVSAGTVAYTNTGLTDGTNYYYEVQAVNSMTASAFSSAANAVTILAAPSGLIATSASSTQINLSWTDHDGGAAAGYDIERSTDQVNFASIATAAFGATTYNDTTVSAGTTYYYEVRAFNTAAGDSAFTNVATIPLATPTSLTATAASPTEIDLNWVNNAPATVNTNIDRSTDGIHFVQIAMVSGSVATYSDTGLTDGTQYYYEVQAFNPADSNTSVFSNIANATLGLSAPSNLTAMEISATQVNLAWTNNSVTATGVDIDRSTDGIHFSQIGTVSPATNTYSDTSLVDQTTYYYEVRAFNSTVGNSAFSNVVTVALPLAAPANLTGAVSGKTINLTWINQSAIETGFDIERSTDGVNFTQIATAGPAITSYADTGLTEQTTYYYRLRDFDASSDISPYTSVATIVLPIVAPTSLAATATSPTQINLNWTNTSSVATGIHVDRSADGVNYTQIATLAATATTYNDTGVVAGAQYYYKVQAFDGSGTSGFSLIANAGTPASLTGLGTDYYFGSNGSAWSTQWTFVNGTTVHTVVSTPTISANTGVVTMTQTGGATGMNGTYTANFNPFVMVDSYESVLINTNNIADNLGLVARDNPAANTYYDVYLASATDINVDQVVNGTVTLIKHGVGTFAANTTYDLVFEVLTANVTTTDIMAKIWAVGTAEPTTWLVNTTNTVAQLQGVSGYDGLTFQPSGTTPATFTVDNFETVNLTATNSGYVDNFENSSAAGWTPLTASRWTVGNDGNSIRYYINTSSYAAGSGGSLGQYSLLSSTGFTSLGNFVMTVDARAASISAGSNYAIVFGYQNATNYYFMEFSSTSGATALYKVVSGTASIVASATGTWVTNVNYHAIKIQRTGANISVWYDGASVLTASDATFGAGEIGLGAVNDAAYFDNVIIGPPVITLTAPSALSATTASASQINLTWTDNDGGNATGYAIDRGTNGIAFTQIATVAAGLAAYTNTGLADDTQYYYEVQALSTSLGNSSFTDAATATTPLAAPSGASASALSISQIKLTWTNNSTAQTSESISRSINGSTFAQIATVAAGTTTFTNSDLTDGTKYYYEIQALAGSATSAESSATSAVTTLAAPSGLSATAASTSQINLSWANNSATETSFTIDRSTDGVNFTQLATVGADTTTYSDTGLIEGRRYFYEVFASNAAVSSSAFSNVANAVTSLAAASALSATAISASQINLNWTDNDGGAAVGYNIDRSTNGVTFTQIATVGASVDTFTNTGLVNGTNYYYEVQAYNGGTSSSFSNVANAVTTLAAPTSLSATTASTSQINLAWTNNSATDTSFNIDRSTNGVTFTQIATVGGSTTTFNDTGLTDGTQYYYEVQAANTAAGDSAFSNVASAVTTLAAPTSLSATTASTSQINLAWTNNSATDTSFNIDRSTDGVTFTQIATVGGSTTAFSDTGLTDGTTYYYEVEAFNTAAGDSAFSNVASAVTTLAAPTALSATTASTSQINLAWTNNSATDTSFHIDRSTDGVTFSQIATVSGSTTTFSDTGLTDGTQYYYEVQAANTAAGDSTFSNVASAVTTLAAPTSLSATTASTSQINLAWTNNSATDTSFNIDRSTDGVTFSQIATVSGSTTTFSDTGLTDGTTYYYEVQAANTAAGDSSFSNVASAVTTLAAPTALSATTASTSQINLVWTNNSASDTGFHIDRSTDGVTFTAVGTVAADVTTFSDTGLTDGTTYYYEVQAFNTSGGGGDSTFSNVASATTTLAAPTALSAATASTSQINLNWTNNSATEAGFNIDRSTDGIHFSQIATVSASSTTFSDTGLTDGTQYSYEVQAFNTAAGDSTFSNVASATTTLAAPTALSATTASTSQINLSWTNNSATESGFNIDRSTDGVTFTPIATVAAGVTTFSDTGLTDGTQYYYEVQAANTAAGSSAFSNVASAVTTLAAPSGLNASAVSTSQIDLSWTNNSATESGFNIDRSTDGIHFTQIATVGAGSSTFNDTGLTDGTQYYYEVQAFNAVAGDSAFSNVATATTMLANSSGLSAVTVSTSQINLSWANNSTTEMGFNIDRSTDGVNFTQIATVNATTTTYNDTGLTDGTEYYYEVQATSGGGNSAFSNIASAVTTLAAPTSLSAATVSTSQINLSWTNNSATDAGFNIDRSTDGIHFTQIATVGGSTTTFSNTGLVDGTRYYYEVQAFNTAAGDSAFSNAANAVTTLAAPTSLAATTASTSQINLSWTNNSATESGFNIDRSTDGVTFTQIATVGGSTTTFSNTGLVDGTRYYYEVQAFNSTAGDSAFSNVATATTTLAAPSGLTAASTTGAQINLSWTNNSATESGFNIDRSTDGIHFTQIATVGASSTTYSDSSGLAELTTYYYEVQAFNTTAGSSAFSNVANATTPILAPSALSATTVSGSQINLAWTNNSSVATGVDIDRSTDDLNFTQIATVGSTVTTYSNTGLSNGTEYFYKVQAFKGAVTSAFSNDANAATTLAAPDAYALFTTGSVADNGGNIINGSMAIGGTGYSLNGAKINGTLYINTGITGSSNGTTPTGGTVVTSLASAISNVDAAASAVGGFVATQTLGAVNDNGTTTTLNGNGGTNVVDITSLTLNNGNLAIHGSASDVFFINITGNVNFNGGSIVLSGGVTAANVLINLESGGSFNNGALYGTLMATTSTVNFNGGTLSGQVIAQKIADNNFTLTQVQSALLGDTVKKGQSAISLFWNSSQGQSLIQGFNGASTSTTLGNWLAATMPDIFGANANAAYQLQGMTNTQVAAFFQSTYLTGSNLYIQLLSTALSIYATDSTLGGSAAATADGFVVNTSGLANATYNVGSNGAAFGVANDSVISVMTLLTSIDNLAKNGQSVNGVLTFQGNTALQNMAVNVFQGINAFGDIV